MFTFNFVGQAPAAGSFLCKKSYMADIPDRDEIEEKLARKVSRAMAGIQKDYVNALIDAGYDWNSPEVRKFYTKLDLEMRKQMAPFLGELLNAQAQLMGETVSFPIDWKLVNFDAANWARGYSTILAGQLADTTRDRVADGIRGSVARYFEEGMTIGQLRRELEANPDLAHLFTEDVKDKLGRVFGPGRAEMIARTEVTRAAVEGERIVADQLIEKGHKMEEIWHTRNDEIVCPICGPRNKKPSGPNTWNRDQGPPAHPRCRCWVRFRMPRKKPEAKPPTIPKVPISGPGITRPPAPESVPGTGFTPAQSKKEAKERLENYINDKGYEVGRRYNRQLHEIEIVRKEGVNFSGHTLDQMNSILKAIEDVGERYNVNFGYIGKQWKRSRSLGSYHHKLKDQSENALAIQSRFIKNAAEEAIEQREAFSYGITRRIERLEEAIADERRAFLLERNRRELEEARALKRWFIAQEESVNPLEAVARHEAYHGVYYQHDLHDRWVDAIRRHNITKIDMNGVSEYGASTITELFPEAATAIDYGIEIPDNVRKAIIEVLEYAK